MVKKGVIFLHSNAGLELYCVFMSFINSQLYSNHVVFA